MTSLPILLGDGFSLLVKKGDTVTPGTILAKRKTQQEIRMDIPAIFRIPRKQAGKLLRKHPGDSVRKGEIIASKKRFLGIKEDEVVSQVDGTILRFERDTGTVILIPHTDSDTFESEQVVSPIDGIVELCDNGKILLSTDKDILPVFSGVGKNAEGEIIVLNADGDSDFLVHLHHLTSAVIGKIIVGGIFDRDVLLKAIGMGAAGVIGSTIRDEDLTFLEERQLTVPVVTIDIPSLQRLAGWGGKRVYLQGEQKTILLLHV